MKKCADARFTMEQCLPGVVWLLERMKASWPDFCGDDRVVTQAVEEIWRQLGGVCDVESIVAKLPQTRRTLERRFRRRLNCGIRDVRAFARLELAKCLLAETSLPINKVAARAGYSSSDWMGKVVRRNTGMTPGEYRRQALADKN